MDKFDQIINSNFTDQDCAAVEVWAWVTVASLPQHKSVAVPPVPSFETFAKLPRVTGPISI